MDELTPEEIKAKADAEAAEELANKSAKPETAKEKKDREKAEKEATKKASKPKELTAEEAGMADNAKCEIVLLKSLGKKNIAGSKEIVSVKVAKSLIKKGIAKLV
jgi:hypothetical protein